MKFTKVSDLPSWEECNAKVKDGLASKVEEFIYEYEPSNAGNLEDTQPDAAFRFRLTGLINEIKMGLNDGLENLSDELRITQERNEL